MGTAFSSATEQSERVWFWFFTAGARLNIHSRPVDTAGFQLSQTICELGPGI